jgi:hypothetical protein
MTAVEQSLPLLPTIGAALVAWLSFRLWKMELKPRWLDHQRRKRNRARIARPAPSPAVVGFLKQYSDELGQQRGDAL